MLEEHFPYPQSDFAKEHYGKGVADGRAMPHVMVGGLTHAPAERLGERLARLLPASLSHCFFTESGSGSVEVAMKMSAQSWQQRGRPSKKRFVSFRGAYHGDSFATMALCDPEEGMQARFQGLMPEPCVADLPTTPETEAALTALLEAHHGSIAAVVIEPIVQAAGGFLFHEPSVLRFLRKACERFESISSSMRSRWASHGAGRCSRASAEVVPESDARPHHRPRGRR